MPVTEFKGFKQNEDDNDDTRRTHGDEDSEDDKPRDEAPWRRRAYGSLLKAPRIAFVAEGSALETPGIVRPKSTKPASEISNWYLNHVLGKPASSSAPASTTASSRTSPQPSTPPTAESTASLIAAHSTSEELCPTCNTPLHETHNTSVAHLCSLPHSHPPHALNRSSVGLKVLTSQGWDPDARVGLGKSGEGIRAPIKLAEKKGKEGVGRKVVVGEKKTKEVKMMGAKEARKHAEKERRARMALMAEFSR